MEKPVNISKSIAISIAKSVALNWSGFTGGDNSNNCVPSVGGATAEEYKLNGEWLMNCHIFKEPHCFASIGGLTAKHYKLDGKLINDCKIFKT